MQTSMLYRLYIYLLCIYNAHIFGFKWAKTDDKWSFTCMRDVARVARNLKSCRKIL